MPDLQTQDFGSSVLHAPQEVIDIVIPLQQYGWCVKLEQLPEYAKHPTNGWVGYDQEYWAASYPDYERPIRYMNLFGKRAKKMGLKVAMACMVSEAGRYTTMLKTEIKYADLLVVQTPEYAQCLPIYAERHREARSIAQDMGKPNLPIIANALTGNGCTDPDEPNFIWNRVRKWCDGYWVWEWGD